MSEEPVYELVKKIHKTRKKCASAGNRTRAARVAGEHSTTEPPMLTYTTDIGKYKIDHVTLTSRFDTLTMILFTMLTFVVMATC